MIMLLMDVMSRHSTSLQDLTYRRKIWLCPLQCWMRSFNLETLIQRPPVGTKLVARSSKHHARNPLMFPSRELHLCTDASGEGWGPNMDGAAVQGGSSDLYKELYIHCLEIRDINQAIKAWTHQFEHSSVLVATDNTATRGSDIDEFVERDYSLFVLADLISCWLGKLNILAYCLSRK